jgi:hypothetical protein
MAREVKATARAPHAPMTRPDPHGWDGPDGRSPGVGGWSGSVLGCASPPTAPAPPMVRLRCHSSSDSHSLHFMVDPRLRRLTRARVTLRRDRGRSVTPLAVDTITPCGSPARP